MSEHADQTISRLPIQSPSRSLAFAVNLALAMAASTVGSFAIGALAPLLREDIGIDASQVGWLATLFLLSGAIFSPIIGDRLAQFGSRRGLMALYLFSAASYLAIAGSPTFSVMLVVMFLAGIAGAGGNPLTNHAIAEHGAPRQRGLILGIKQSGVQIGIFLSGAGLPVVGVAFGWRWAMTSAIVLPIAGVLLTRVVTPRDDRASPQARQRERHGVLLRMLTEHRFLAWLFGYALLMGGSMSAISTYLPLYAYDELDFTVTRAALAASAVGLTGIFARVLWGRIVEGRGVRLRVDLLVIACGSTLMGIVFLSAAQLGAWAVWVGAIGVGGITSGWNVVAMMTLIRDLPSEKSAAATGVVQLGFYIGLLSGPVTFGGLLALTGGYAGAWTGVTSGFATASLLVLIWSLRTRRVGVA